MENTKNNIVKIVIGSWGSYNACNERALGSEWLTLNDFNSWEEIEEELKKEGFKLDGIDEELFIQDYEADFEIPNCDYTHPQRLFEMLKASGILEDEYKYDVALAYIDYYGFKEFCDVVDEKGDNWDEDIIFYKNYSLYDYGYEIAHEFEKIPEWLENYVDYEAIGRDEEYNGSIHLTDYGILQVY